MSTERGHMHKGRRILIVDDEPANRKLLRALVIAEGHEALEASDGRQALDILSDQDVDLVLLDVMMPGIDGMGVLTALRDQGRLPDLPVIMVSALTDRKSRIIAVELGAVDFLNKPLDRLESVAKIRTLSQLRELRRSASREAAYEATERTARMLRPQLGTCRSSSTV